MQVNKYATTQWKYVGIFFLFQIHKHCDLTWMGQFMLGSQIASIHTIVCFEQYKPETIVVSVPIIMICINDK